MPRYDNGFRLLACVAGLLLTGCDSGPSPILTPPRPGADRQIAAGSLRALPAADRHYDSSVAPTDETRDLRVGSSVSGKGGQKAQRETEEKERAAFLADRARARAEEGRDEAEPQAPAEGSPKSQ
jgi:hypothetical protein